MVQKSVSVLVTGGSGFIGRNLVPALAEEYQVLAPSHSELDLMDEDSVARFLDAHQVDVIVHSATKPGHRNAADPTGLVYANTRMFFNLVRRRASFGRLILLGSGAEYDIRHYQPKMREEYFDTHVPVDETGFSKYVVSKYIDRLDDAVDLRMFGVFGPHEDYAIRFISNAICKALFDLPITLRQNRRFDYLYVHDLAPIVSHFVSHDPARSAYNVTPDSSIELYELAETVRTVSGKHELPILVAVPGMGPEYSGSNGRLREFMPGVSFTPIEQSVRELYAWYEERKPELDRSLLLVDK